MSSERHPVATFTTIPADREWASAYFLTIRRRWLWRRLAITFLGIWIVYFALVAAIDVNDYGWNSEFVPFWLKTSLEYSLIVATCLIAITVALTPRRVRKVVQDTRRLAPEMHFEVDETGITCRNAISTSTLSWQQFERWYENRHVILLMVTRNSFYIIRKIDLASGVEEALRSLPIAANVPIR